MALALPLNHSSSKQAAMLTTVMTATQADQKSLVKSLIFLPLRAR
jgi:hypothetical protein